MDNKNIHEEKNQVINENKGRGLFYAVIAVATFIIMAVGATFAYFTATTNSADSAVKTGSTTLKLKYISYESGWMNKDLIPADTTVVEYSFENQNDTTIKKDDENGDSYSLLKNGLCKDDFGNSICSVYVFQVRNDANSPQTVSLDVVSETNQFKNLNAMAYEIAIPEDTTEYDSKDNNNGLNDPLFKKGDGTDSGENLIDVVDSEKKVLNLKKVGDASNADVYSPIFVNRKGITKTLLQYVESSDSNLGTSVKKPAIDRLIVQTVGADGEDLGLGDEVKSKTANIAGDLTINGGETKTYALVLYVKNLTSDQTKDDAAKEFTGRVVISSGDGSTGVSGTISVVNEETKNNLQSNQQR